MSIKILIVDDSIIARSGVKKLLIGSGFEIEEAKNGLEGYLKLKSGDYDLALLDLLMPEMTGYELLEKLKEEGVKTPVVALSADIQETTKSACFELGAAGFVCKPPQKEELLQSIRKAIHE